MILRRWLVRLLGGLAGAVLLYWAVASVGMFIPVNSDVAETPDGIEIFLWSNDVHVDVAVPVVHPVKDWRIEGLVTHPDTAYLAFGWGERDFYLRTPTWADFSLVVGVKSLLWQPALMHVVEWPSRRPNAIRLTVSADQYARLVRGIRSGFAPGPVRILPGKGYGRRDNFYEGAGAYSMFMTCNQWTNRRLADAGIRAVLWSPLPEGVMRAR
ncbi:TIGR02117 family protein [Emcibacter sp. SYSU 3D8]|uniref:TIGR02117 family protein n=1 Tax=Emcibacter sp. SYSU 3D8 TaxID=3133969 RepID=UPI0031FEECD3